MFALCIDRMSNAMANNSGKLARSSTLKTPNIFTSESVK